MSIPMMKDFVFNSSCFFFWFQDEKLQHVLGHFQKDFEGGVCAENLGKELSSCCRLLSFSAFEREIKQGIIF